MIGFKTFEKKKDEENKKYCDFKDPLYFLILIISFFSLYFEFLVFNIVYFMIYIILFQIFFLIYFIIFSRRRTRCWIQHRMIIYHFLLISILYYSYLVLDNNLVLGLFILIYVYNIVEFRFAKFNIKQNLIWD